MNISPVGHKITERFFQAVIIHKSTGAMQTRYRNLALRSELLERMHGEEGARDKGRDHPPRRA